MVNRLKLYKVFDLPPNPEKNSIYFKHTPTGALGYVTTMEGVAKPFVGAEQLIDAPLDGGNYVRNMGEWVQIQNPTQYFNVSCYVDEISLSIEDVKIFKATPQLSLSFPILAVCVVSIENAQDQNITVELSTGSREWIANAVIQKGQLSAVFQSEFVGSVGEADSIELVIKKPNSAATLQRVTCNLRFEITPSALSGNLNVPQSIPLLFEVFFLGGDGSNPLAYIKEDTTERQYYTTINREDILISQGIHVIPNKGVMYAVKGLNEVVEISLNTGEVGEVVISEPTGEIKNLILSPDGEDFIYVLVQGGNLLMKIFNKSLNAHLNFPLGSSSQVINKIAVSKTGRQVAIAGNTLEFLFTTSGDMHTIRPAGEGPFTDVEFSAEGMALISLGQSLVVHLTNNGEVLPYTGLVEFSKPAGIAVNPYSEDGENLPKFFVWGQDSNGGWICGFDATLDGWYNVTPIIHTDFVITSLSFTAPSLSTGAFSRTKYGRGLMVIGEAGYQLLILGQTTLAPMVPFKSFPLKDIQWSSVNNI